MAEKKQFDELLGGSEELPREAHIKKLVSARASEIAAMAYSLENPQQNKLIFQKLPVHMRRRVMSHNAKRMPRKLRNGHISQMEKSGLPPKIKKPSRKYRRRPRNLLDEYNRRQRNKFWLETHIWHAKRFKMTEKWGFRLGNYSNDRCFRANYRAVMKHCLIQDISYYTCIEIKGSFDVLKETLKMHCNPNELTFGAKCFVNGEREGTLMFYKKNGYPFSPIGYVKFLWNPCDRSKAIWIWVHPAFYGEVLQELISSFEFKLLPSPENFNNDENLLKNDIDSHVKIFQFTKIPMYSNKSGCEMIILRNSLNRFRISGPLTMSVILDAFKIPKMSNNELNQISIENQNSEKIDYEINTDDEQIDIWFKNYFQIPNNAKTFEIQKNTYDILSTVKTPNQLPPNMVLGLTVLDPRFYMPYKRTKIQTDASKVDSLLSPPKFANQSALWEADVRNYVTRNSVNSSKINNVRSQNLVPGVKNDAFYNQNVMSKIPILLIQKPGVFNSNSSIGFSSGIDIVLPAGWAMQFWLALILRCARPGGLREAKNISFESSDINNPVINHPDTKAYQLEFDLKKAELIEIYFKRPPNKRVNYVKFGITSPFSCEWNILMNEWSSTTNYFVLRDQKLLQLLNNNLSQKKLKSKVSNGNCNNQIKKLTDLIEHKNCLIPVKISIERKGLPKDLSIICLPTPEDLRNFSENKNWSGPLQTLKNDPNETKKKEIRRGHIALLRRLRRKRIRAKNKLERATIDIPLKDSKDTKKLIKIKKLVKKKILSKNQTIIDEQAEKMANFCLPKCDKVRNSCDREVIGYVTQGGYSFSEAKGIGLGYIVFSSVLELIQQNCNLVLSRNTSTRKFRFCKIEILHS